MAVLGCWCPGVSSFSLSSVHQAESSVGQDFPSHLHRPLSDCHFADIQGYYARDIAPNSYLTMPCLVSLIREGRLGGFLVSHCAKRPFIGVMVLDSEPISCHVFKC